MVFSDKPPAKVQTGDADLQPSKAPVNNAIFGAAQEAYKPKEVSPILAAANAAPLLDQASVFKDVKAPPPSVPKVDIAGVTAADMAFKPSSAMAKQTDDNFFAQVDLANKGKLPNDQSHSMAA